jgi:hypothetical protein
MDATVMELMKGPAGETPQQRLVWFKKVHFACASATEGSVKMIAQPLKKAMDILEKLEVPTEPVPENVEAELAMHLLHAQGLSLYVYLEELNRMRNAVATEVAKLKAGTPDRKKGEQLQGAYEQAIDGLARAYNGLRAGKLDEMKTIVPVMEEVRKIAAELAK